MPSKSQITLSRRDEFSLRIACALFQSPRGLRITEEGKPSCMVDPEEVGRTAVEIADAMLGKLDGHEDEARLTSEEWDRQQEAADAQG